MSGHYKKHLFFCVNQKLNGKKCCAESQAQMITDYAKKKLQEMGQHGKGLFRVSASACLGRCAKGPSLIVYPEAVWYTYNTIEDIDEIIESHLLNDVVVERLQMAPDT
jgi:(2Fe-2S) ferredoxin